MKKILQTNIGGRPFHLDEDAYSIIRDYLDSLKAYFSKEEDAGKEIIEDIEDRLAELLISRISEKKQVVDIEDVNFAIKTLGKIEEFEFTRNEKIESEPVNYNRRDYRKLFRDPDDYYIGGVCGGLASYLNIDPLWMRILFVVLIFANGFGVLLYLIFWLIVPKARTTAEKLQMKGEPVTIENIKRSVSDEYGKVTSTWKNSETLRKGRSAAEEILSVIGRIIVVFFKIILGIIGFAFLMAGIAIMLGVGAVIFAKKAIFIDGNRFDLPDIAGLFNDPAVATIIIICLIVLIAIPIIALIVGGIKLIFNIRSRNRALTITAVTAWFLALIIFGVMLLSENDKIIPRVTNSNTVDLSPVKSSKLYISVDENVGFRDLTTYSIFNYNFYVSRDKRTILGKPRLIIREGGNDYPQLTIRKVVRNVDPELPDYYFEKIEYNWEQNDSVIILDKFFTVDKEEKWNFPQVELVLEVPQNKQYELLDDVDELVNDYNDHWRYTEDWD